MIFPAVEGFTTVEVGGGAILYDGIASPTNGFGLPSSPALAGRGCRMLT